MSDTEEEVQGETLDGTVIRARQFDSGWTILSVDRGGMPETWVGIAPELKEGMPVRATGQWQTDQKWGRQFKMATVLVKMPDAADPGALAAFLAKLVPGVAIRTTTKLVDALGAETIPTLEAHDLQKLMVKGTRLTEDNAKKLCEEWQKHSVEGQLIVQLGRFGIKGAVAKRVVKKYGSRAAEMVEKHPYVLAMEVDGIGFKTADLIAKSVGIPHDSVERMEAGLLYSYEEKFYSRGHCYAHQGPLFDAAATLLEVGDGPLSAGLEAAKASGRFVVEEAEEPRIYPAALYVAERRVASRLARLLAAPALLRKEDEVPDLDDDMHGMDDPLSEREPRLPCRSEIPCPSLQEMVDHGEKAIVEYECTTGMTLAAAQRDAVRAVMRQKVFILTGGPGVGKTQTTKAIIFALETMGFDIACCAPTGRAAKRVKEATGKQASTVHRLLEYHPEKGFQRNSGRRLQQTVIIGDEFSMTDISLMAHLTDAIDDGARFVIIGDVDQLPSVGPGAVLRDMIESGAMPVVRLTEVFRQAAGSRIITNAHRVNRGETPEKPQGDSDFYWVERTDADRAAATAVQIITEKLAKRGISSRDCMVISPQKNGEAGVHAMNARLQEVLNPRGPCLTFGKAPKQRVFRVNDPVMQLKNDYERAVWNGDIGTVIAVNPDKTEMVVSIDGVEVLYEKKHFENVTLAYACSGHKMQGGQAKAIVILMLRQHFTLLSRPWAYTAITRAEKLCVLIADASAVSIALSETKRENRNTGLCERIRLAVKGEA